MAATFRAESDPDDALISELARLEPLRAFCTPAYLAFRRARGEAPWLLLLAEGGRLAAGCTAFMESGRVNTSLDIPSAPGPFDDDVFWRGLKDFCRRSGVTRLSVGTFASNEGTLPNLGPEASRKLRWEFPIDLTSPELFQGMSKGHRYRLKVARKAGLELRRVRDREACQAHAALIDASMSRRQERGEDVAPGTATRQFERLLDTGAGELFQAVRDGAVMSSNLILMSEGAGYSHTSGTSPEGMKSGAAHFLIHETGMALRADGKAVFNLGGTDEPGSGLEGFKKGFGKSVRRVSLDAVAVRWKPGLTRLAGAVTGLVPRSRGRRLEPV